MRKLFWTIINHFRSLNMTINHLSQVSDQAIVTCLLEAFEGYFVPLPADVAYWSQRFRHARVDKQFSWGVFDKGRLVGFIINAIDQDKGMYTAYNTGTGVIPDYRGHRLVDKMYAWGLPQLKQQGVSRCTLEVIVQNAKAIKVYERIGFTITERMKCYKGELPNMTEGLVKECPLESVCHNADDHYSWDNTGKTVVKASQVYKAFYTYRHQNAEQASGYFIINPQNGYIAQVETLDGHWDTVFAGLSQIATSIRINNILDTRRELNHFLVKTGIENTIDQFKMELLLNPG